MAYFYVKIFIRNLEIIKISTFWSISGYFDNIFCTKCLSETEKLMIAQLLLLPSYLEEPEGMKKRDIWQTDALVIENVGIILKLSIEFIKCLDKIRPCYNFFSVYAL